MNFRSLFPQISQLKKGDGILPVWQVLFLSLSSILGGSNGKVVFGPSSIKPTRTTTLVLGDESIKLKGFKLNGDNTQSGVVIASSTTESGLSTSPFSAGVSYPTGSLIKTVSSEVPAGWAVADSSYSGRALGAAGSGNGLTPRDAGDSVGEYTHLTTEAEMAEHEHSISERSNDPNLTVFKLENYGTYNLNGRFAESVAQPTSSSGYTQQPRNNTQASVFFQLLEKQG